ncbi:hypothetical protein GGR53DRAFT_526390 [Hypoxylon sp. FL1150]|nr:hypothetical protein GGR53DRAFT_526390 [Hypoxylon sp. FL1150]
MASRHDPDPKLEVDVGSRSSSGTRAETMASKSAQYGYQQQQQQQQYPPPQALPDYVNRALPPRPRTASNASSIYDSSPGEGSSAQWPVMKSMPMSGQPPVVTEEDEEQHTSPTSAGVLDQAGLALVQPLHPALVSTPPQPGKEIAAPQPRYPASKVLEVKNFVVSPVSAALPVNDGGSNGSHDEVSPVSPADSRRSLHSRISASTSRPTSPTAATQTQQDQNASSLHRTPTDKSDRRRAVYKGYRTTHSEDPATAAGSGSGSPRSPHYQVHQINDRYSDPGSPITGAVLHPPTSFPSDPSLRSSRQLSEARQRQQSASQDSVSHAKTKTKTNIHSCNENPETTSPPGSTGAKLAPVASVGSSNGSQRVAFAGLQRSDSGFAARPRAGSKRGAPPPPPLKLSERPLAGGYVKTPFPDLNLGGVGDEDVDGDGDVDKGGAKGTKGKKGEEKGKERDKGGEGQPRSRFSHGRESSSLDLGRRWMGIGIGIGKDKEKEKEGETPNSAKRRNRVSSLPGLGFLRSGPLSGNKLDKEAKEGNKETPQAAAAAAVPMPSEVRSGYVESTRTGTRPSRTPSVSKVKNILSKAKQIGLNHGLGMSTMLSSEETKKERRRAEMKKQIRVEHARPA